MPSLRVNRRPVAGLRYRPLGLLFLGLVLGTLGLPSSALATRLCMQPLSIPIDDDDERSIELERAVTAVLEQGNFEIVDSTKVKDVAERIDAKWGAIYDPITGARVQEKWELYKRELAEALWNDLGCDGRLSIAVVKLQAPFYDDMARWDGAEEPVTSSERSFGFGLGASGSSGWVSALSLWVTVMDIQGQPLIFRSAGIEPLTSFSMTRGEDMLPKDQWLRNKARLSLAVLSALGEDGYRMHQSW